MDNKKKQMILVAVLAVLGLGWGSYYFFIRDTGSADLGSSNQGRTERRVREDVKNRDASTSKRRTKKRAVATKKEAPTRRVREVTDRATGGKRKTRRGKTTKVKKKKLVPAA